MSEHDLILISGAPGSGKSRLGRTLAHELAAEDRSVEHVSTGDLMRAIGSGAIRADQMFRGIVAYHLADNRSVNVGKNGYEIPRALTPIDDTVVYELLAEHLHRLAATTTVILDGYPRYDSQVPDFYKLTEFTERTLRGVIVTEADEETSLARQLKRQPRIGDTPLTASQAIWRMEDYHENAATVHSQLVAYRSMHTSAHLPFEFIETDGTKEETTARGLKFAREVLRRSDAV